MNIRKPWLHAAVLATTASLLAAATLAPLNDSQLSDLERLYDERIRAHVHDRW